MDRAFPILQKIEQKGKEAKAKYPVTATFWLTTDKDAPALEANSAMFKDYHMSCLYQSLTLEKMCEANIRDSTALMEQHVNNHVDEFRSDNITKDRERPNKMFYDSIRINGL